MSKRICYRVRLHLPNNSRLLSRILEKEINIYVGLTEMQRKWYWSVLEKDIDVANGEQIYKIFPSLSFDDVQTGLTGTKEGKTRLMNMIMQVGVTSQGHMPSISF